MSRFLPGNSFPQAAGGLFPRDAEVYSLQHVLLEGISPQVRGDLFPHRLPQVRGDLFPHRLPTVIAQSQSGPLWSILLSTWDHRVAPFGQPVCYYLNVTR